MVCCRTYLWFSGQLNEINKARMAGLIESIAPMHHVYLKPLLSDLNIIPTLILKYKIL